MARAAQQMPVAAATPGLNVTQTSIPLINILVTSILSASKSKHSACPSTRLPHATGSICKLQSHRVS